MEAMSREVTQVETLLSDWNKAIDRALGRGALLDAAAMAQIVLRELPRHLATYQRLLRMTWTLKRWDEGEDWARRLLQADPGNALAWRSLARAAEQRGRRGQAHAMWQRAFEMAPYDPETRAGLVRTSLDDPHAPALDLACLGTLYRRGRRWDHAAAVYRQLVKADPRRIDFQICLMLALWQSRATGEAYALARHLVQHQPHLLLAWATLDAVGDENDQALARHPLASMDPDGEFVSGVLGMPVARDPVMLTLSLEDAVWLDAYLAEKTAL